MTVAERNIDDLFLRARGLELVSVLLAKRGASHDEVEAHLRELQRVRRELVALVGGGA
jgi:hypothetical protein